MPGGLKSVTIANCQHDTAFEVKNYLDYDI